MMEKTVSGITWRKEDYRAVWDNDDGWGLHHRGDVWWLYSPDGRTEYRLKSREVISEPAMREAAEIIKALREHSVEVKRAIAERRSRRKKGAE